MCVGGEGGGKGLSVQEVHVDNKQANHKEIKRQWFVRRKLAKKDRVSLSLAQSKAMNEVHGRMVVNEIRAVQSD